MILTLKFQICLAVSIVLLGISMYVSTEQYVLTKATYDTEITAQQHGVNTALALDESELDELDYDLFVQTVFRKPTPLSIFCYGREGDFGSQVKMGIFPQTWILFAQPAGKTDISGSTFDFSETLKDTFEHIDLVFCIKILLSLMVIFLAFDLVSGERESDTLKMIHANHVSRLTVIMGKWLAGALIIGVVLLGMMLISLLYILLVKNIAFDSRIVACLAMLYTVSIVYLMLYYQLTLFISVNARTSKQVVIGMFIVWCIASYLAPILGIEIGKISSTVPSWNEIEQMNSETQIKYNEEATKDPTITGEQKLDIWNRRQVDYRNTIYSFLDRLRRQGHLANLLAMISPAHIYQVISERIAGTSVEDYEFFMDRARHELVSYWDMVYNNSYLSKTRNKSRMTIDRNVSMFDASQDNNRLSIRKTASSIVILMFPLVVVNGMLFLMILIWYEHKPIII